MKVNLMISGKGLNGYLNLCQTNNGEQDSIAADLSCIDNLVDHNECKQILGMDVINFFPLGMVSKVILHWLTKLEHGGEIVLSALNIPEVARLIHNGAINDTVKINQILFHKVTNIWDIRKSYVSINDLISIIMSSNQFDIVGQKLDGLFYVITARRR